MRALQCTSGSPHRSVVIAVAHRKLRVSRTVLCSDVWVDPQSSAQATVLSADLAATATGAVGAVYNTLPNITLRASCAMNDTLPYEYVVQSLNVRSWTNFAFQLCALIPEF